MSVFRRRLMAMQKKDSIDWDYEWSYLSGQLPQDERFIKSIKDNVYLTDEGLKFDGKNAFLNLQNHNRISVYFKCNINYITGNNTRGFSICLYNDNIGDKNKEIEVLFDGVNNNVTLTAGPNQRFGNYELGKDVDFQIHADFNDEWNNMNNSYALYGGEKFKLKDYKRMWYNYSSSIKTDNGMFGSEGYVLLKELKIKVYDS